MPGGSDAHGLRVAISGRYGAGSHAMVFASDRPIRKGGSGNGTRRMEKLPPHLRRLESEAIEIMREVAAEFRNPVMLYSVGKDSSVMLHLGVKAFYPSRLPFPLLHIDTT